MLFITKFDADPVSLDINIARLSLNRAGYLFIM